MKKKLEADLISIAHRILQMKNKSDINQLCIETQILHEKLSILRFVELHFGDAKPTIGLAEVTAKIKQSFEEDHLSEVQPARDKIEFVTNDVAKVEVVSPEADEHKIANGEKTLLTEFEYNKIEPNDDGDEISREQESSKFEEIGFRPVFELDIEVEEPTDTPKKAAAAAILFDDFLGSDYSNTQFVKLEKEEEYPKPSLDFELLNVAIDTEKNTNKAIFENTENKAVSLNDKLSKTISVGLNDRIAFVKQLFGNSEEDYNRVLNQLITYDSFQEAQNFIEDMVKPDYNNWEGKEDYSQRFVEIIEKKFA